MGGADAGMGREESQALVDEDDEEQYVMWKVEDMRRNIAFPSHWEFFVRWKGYPPEDNTWEGPKAFTDPDLYRPLLGKLSKLRKETQAEEKEALKALRNARWDLDEAIASLKKPARKPSPSVTTSASSAAANAPKPRTEGAHPNRLGELKPNLARRVRTQTSQTHSCATELDEGPEFDAECVAMMQRVEQQVSRKRARTQMAATDQGAAPTKRAHRLAANCRSSSGDDGGQASELAVTSTRPQFASGEVWGHQKSVFAVIGCDTRTVIVVRLYRRADTFVAPYATSCGLTHALIACDRQRKIPLAEFSLGKKLLGMLCEGSQLARQSAADTDVPIESTFVYHQRFPVSFRTSPSPSTVLGAPESSMLSVRCCSSSAVALLVPAEPSPAQLHQAAPPVFSQHEHCSQDERYSQAEAEDPEEWSERVLLSQTSDPSAAATTAGVRDDDDDPDDEMPDDSSGMVGPISQKLLALELYAGCGGLAHMAGSSHGVEICVAWSVECMPEAAASNRANHPHCKVLEMTAAALNDQITEWIGARDRWQALSRQKRERVMKQPMLVKDHMIMKDLTGSAGDGYGQDDSDDDDDFANNEPWSLVEIVDFQAVTRPHKLDAQPWSPEFAGNEIWMEYRCQLMRGVVTKTAWVEFSKKEQGKPVLDAYLGKFVEAMVEKKAIPLPEVVDLVCGGPPCQGMSGHNMHRQAVAVSSCGRIEQGDPKTKELDVFLDCIRNLRPRFMLLENVAAMLAWPNFDTSMGRYIMARMIQCEYQCSVQLLFAGAYGLCTSRPRTVIIGAAAGEELPIAPRPSHHVPAKDWKARLRADIAQLVQRPAERRVKRGHQYDDGRGPLRKALTLRDVIGHFPSFESKTRDNGDNVVNTVWEDRWCVHQSVCCPVVGSHGMTVYPVSHLDCLM
jgi:site-specific DNA-cytosine methylase